MVGWGSYARVHERLEQSYASLPYERRRAAGFSNRSRASPRVDMRLLQIGIRLAATGKAGIQALLQSLAIGPRDGAGARQRDRLAQKGVARLRAGQEDDVLHGFARSVDEVTSVPMTYRPCQGLASGGDQAHDLLYN